MTIAIEAESQQFIKYKNQDYYSWTKKEHQQVNQKHI